jgi:outer membrane protein assembly factor BamB
MKRIFVIFLLPMLLTSCNHIGKTNVKNLIDLTERLEVETSDSLQVKGGVKHAVSVNKTKSYQLAKNAIIGQPAIAQNVIYSVDGKGYVSAFSLKTKKILWSTDLAKGHLDRGYNIGSVLYSNEKLYVVNGSRYLVILDANNGHEIIRKEFPDIVRIRPVMVNDRLLIVQTISNQLIAYDVKSSKFVWAIEGGLETISTRNSIYPTIHNGYVLASFSSGEVIFADAKTGEQKWRYNLMAERDVASPSFEPSVIVTEPIISGNYVYFATSSGDVVKMDVDNGAPSWTKQIYDVQSMNLVGDSLFVTTNARQIAGLSAHNGKISWVGNLISQKERSAKKVNVTAFQTPFVTEIDQGKGFAVNVIASNGELYQFNSDSEGKLPENPKIIKIEKNMRYHWISCCSGELYLIGDSHIRF